MLRIGKAAQARAHTQDRKLLHTKESIIVHSLLHYRVKALVGIIALFQVSLKLLCSLLREYLMQSLTEGVELFAVVTVLVLPQIAHPRTLGV